MFVVLRTNFNLERTKDPDGPLENFLTSSSLDSQKCLGLTLLIGP